MTKALIQSHNSRKKYIPITLMIQVHWLVEHLFWNYSLTMICPIQLLRPAKKPMAGPSSCKGQNKVGDNFKIGAQRVNVLVSSMCYFGKNSFLHYHFIVWNGLWFKFILSKSTFLHSFMSDFKNWISPHN